MRGICDACGYGSDGGTPVEEYGPAFGELFNKYGRRTRFCEVCASTFISQVETNPQNLHDPMMLYRTMGRLANIIIDAISVAQNGRRR